ncbi:MAG TPA: hypothetical protein VIG95_07770, partial [Gemmatimonadales bacterium]
LFFHAASTGRDTPVVVVALSIASVTYGPLLGTYFLAGRWSRAQGRDVVGAVGVTVLIMLVVVFAGRLSAAPVFHGLSTIGKLAWPWYVPLGTLICVSTGIALSYFPHPTTLAADERR